MYDYFGSRDQYASKKGMRSCHVVFLKVVNVSNHQELEPPIPSNREGSRQESLHTDLSNQYVEFFDKLNIQFDFNFVPRWITPKFKLLK